MSEGAPADDETHHGYVVGQDNIEVLGLDIHNPVFVISALVVVGFVVLSLVFQTEAKHVFLALRPSPFRRICSAIRLMTFSGELS